MKKLMKTLATAFVSLTVLVFAANAEELLGVLIKVDTEAKKVTVLQKDTDKEIEVKINDETEYVSKKGTNKIDLEKVAKGVERAKEKGKKGIDVTVTHEKGVASKIDSTTKKKAEN